MNRLWSFLTKQSSSTPITKVTISVDIKNNWASGQDVLVIMQKACIWHADVQKGNNENKSNQYNVIRRQKNITRVIGIVNYFSSGHFEKI